MVRSLAALFVGAGLLLGACGSTDETSAEDQAAADEAAIVGVMRENELGGPERCETLYTDAYLEMNWNEDVTAYGGGTPLEKCQAQPKSVATSGQVKVEVLSVDGDTAVATLKVGAYEPSGYSLVRDPETGDWQIDGFED